MTIILKPKKKFKDIWGGYDHPMIDFVADFAEDLSVQMAIDTIPSNGAEALEGLIKEFLNQMYSLAKIKGMRKDKAPFDGSWCTSVTLFPDTHSLQIDTLDVDGDECSRSIDYERPLQMSAWSSGFLPPDVQGALIVFATWVRHDLLPRLGTPIKADSGILSRSKTTFKTVIDDVWASELKGRANPTIKAHWNDLIVATNPYQIVPTESGFVFQMKEGDSIFAIYQKPNKYLEKGIPQISCRTVVRDGNASRPSESVMNTEIGRVIVAREKGEELLAKCLLGLSDNPKYVQIYQKMDRTNEKFLEGLAVSLGGKYYV